MVQVKRVGQPKVRTAKVKLLKGVVLGPGEVGQPGDIYELPKHVATQLVATKQAEYTDEGDPSEGDDPGAQAHKDGYSTVTVEEATNRDPRPRKRN
jgi:hypothetical protein